MFVAPGLFNIIQPFFISARTLYQTREAPSKMFGWFPWTTAMIITEIPWMLLAMTVNWTVWYLIVCICATHCLPRHEA